MNVYFLVEGATAEPLLYRKWMEYSLPNYCKYEKPEDAYPDGNGYHLVSGGGIPSIYGHIKNAIETIHASGNYDFFVISIDAEDVTYAERYEEIKNQVSQHDLPENCQSVIVVQDCCIETWLLANATAITNPPENGNDASAFFNHYDVTEKDPELLPKPSDHKGTRADYHYKYLKGVLQACTGRGCRKGRPGPYSNYEYWNGMCERLETHPTHMRSFRCFVNFLQKIAAMHEQESLS